MTRLIIVNLLGAAPDQSRTVVGEELLRRAAGELPSGTRAIFAVSDYDAWRAALGSEVELMRCGIRSLWGARWFEGLYVQLVLPLRARKADRVFSISPIFPVLLGKKNVVMIHDCAYRRFPEDAPLLARLYVRAMYALAAKYAARIVTISHFSAGEIEHYYGVPKGEIAILPNSLPRIEEEPDEVADEIANRFAGGHPFFLYVGMTRYRKNIPTMLDAFAAFSDKNPEYRLVMVGKPDPRFLDLPAEVRKRKLEGRVVLGGFVSTNPVKAALMQRSTALVLPSLYEGFGLHILEGQRMGLPVIASGIPSLREVAGGAVLFVDDPLDAAGFTAAMERVASDPTLRAELIERGRANYPRYSWERNVETLVEILSR